MGQLTTKKQTLMGGLWEISFYPQKYISKQNALDIVDIAFREIKRIENLLTDFKDSEFNNINKNAGIKPTIVSKEIINLILYSIQYSKLSHGAFDISFASMGKYFQNAYSGLHEFDEDGYNSAKQFVNYNNIIINQENSTVYLPHKEMKISLGGIGKGYAVDKAYLLLTANGLENFIINGAGDLRIHSRLDSPRNWRIGILNPFNTQNKAGYLQLSNGAIATSGTYERKIDKLHHIISKEDTNYHNEIASITIWTHETITADTLATLGILLGKKKALSLYNHKKIFAIIIDNDGNVILSNKAHQYMKRTTYELQTTI